MVPLAVHVSRDHPRPPSKQLPRVRSPQLSPLLDRPAHLSDRNLDAERGARLAHAPPDRLGAHAWVSRLRAIAAGSSAFAVAGRAVRCEAHGRDDDEGYWIREERPVPSESSTLDGLDRRAWIPVHEPSSGLCAGDPPGRANGIRPPPLRVQTGLAGIGVLDDSK